MRYIKIKKTDLLKSVIELSIAYNTNIPSIVLMGYLQKTWEECERQNIQHPILGDKKIVIERTISFYPQFRDSIIEAEKRDFQNLKKK